MCLNLFKCNVNAGQQQSTICNLFTIWQFRNLFTATELSLLRAGPSWFKRQQLSSVVEPMGRRLKNSSFIQQWPCKKDENTMKIKLLILAVRGTGQGAVCTTLKLGAIRPFIWSFTRFMCCLSACIGHSRRFTWTLNINKTWNLYIFSFFWNEVHYKVPQQTSECPSKAQGFSTLHPSSLVFSVSV